MFALYKQPLNAPCRAQSVGSLWRANTEQGHRRTQTKNKGEQFVGECTLAKGFFYFGQFSDVSRRVK